MTGGLRTTAATPGAGPGALGGDPPVAVFVTVHCWASPNRASFHHIAAAFHRAGWRVLFLTVSISPI